MKKVKELLNERPPRDIFSLVPEQSILSAAQYMRQKNVGAVAVMKNDHLLGVLSERDMLNKVVGPGLDPRDVFVGQMMSRPATTVSPDDTWEECLTKMRRTHCRHLPVIEDGRLIAMISLREVIGIDETEALDEYLWERDLRQEEPEFQAEELEQKLSD